MKIIFVRTSESSVRSLKRVRCERKSYISLRESEMCEKHEGSMRNYEICEWEVWIKGDMSEKVMCKKWSVCGVMWVEKVRGVWRDREMWDVWRSVTVICVRGDGRSVRKNVICKK